MFMDKSLTCIMSVYNSAQTLPYSIESILNQTYSKFKFYIMNDGSSDNSKKILEKYASKDERIKLFQNSENLGLTKSLNILINESKTDLIARQDSDDKSMPNRFEKQISYLNKNNLDAVTALAKGLQTNKVIHLKSTLIPKKILIKYKNPYIHGSLVIKKKVLEEVGNYNEAFYLAQDYKLMYDLIEKKFKVKTLNKILYILNQKDTLSTKFYNEQKYYSDCIKNKTLPIK